MTFASELTVEGEHGHGSAATATPRPRSSTATLPPLVSVTDQINEPRYPSFKGIMAAKKKPLETWSLADLGVDAAQVGLDAAWTRSRPSPPARRAAQGEIVTDEGDGGSKLAEFLVRAKFV